jgi:hypothetical protein
VALLVEFEFVVLDHHWYVIVPVPPLALVVIAVDAPF